MNRNECKNEDNYDDDWEGIKLYNHEYIPNYVLDLTGLRFAALVAEEIVGQDYFGSIIYRCICDCGNEINVSGRDLYDLMDLNIDWHFDLLELMKL